MKLPSMPQRGGSVETTVRDIINYIRATTVTSVNGGVLRETPNGTIINVQKPGVTSTSAATLPFEVSATSAALRAEAGTFCSVYFAATIQSSPANGNWYFYGKAIINQTTGVVSSPTVAWYSATQTSTSTNKYHLIGTAGLTAGVVTYYDNTDYGPISNYPHGDVNDNWTLFFF